jgi:hypothetical protein
MKNFLKQSFKVIAFIVIYLFFLGITLSPLILTVVYSNMWWMLGLLITTPIGVIMSGVLIKY